MKLLRFRSLVATLTLGLSAAASNLSAAIITFTHTGSGSGSINGNAFGNSAFTITGVGDTSARQSFSQGYFITHLSTSINIVGVGTFNFVTAMDTFFNDTGDIVGVSRTVGPDIFNGPSSALLNGWDMLSSIGPIAGDMFLTQWTAANTAVQTSGGQLTFNDGTSSGSFTAVVGAGVPDTSSSLLLAGLALAGLVGLRRLKLAR